MSLPLDLKSQLCSIRRLIFEAALLCNIGVLNLTHPLLIQLFFYLSEKSSLNNTVSKLILTMYTDVWIYLEWSL